MTKTQRLINRIQEKESFYDVAYVCEDFETFEIEVAEWGVDHIAGVDFDDPEANVNLPNTISSLSLMLYKFPIKTEGSGAFKPPLFSIKSFIYYKFLHYSKSSINILFNNSLSFSLI